MGNDPACLTVREALADRLHHYVGERPLYDLHGVEEEIEKARADYPGVRVIVHPECPMPVVDAADAASLRAWALHLGVSEERIRTEAVSAGTFSSMRAVEPILRAERIRTIALVTSPYHQRRAFLTAIRVFGNKVRVFNHPARPSTWSPRRFWATEWSRRIVVSENVKLAYYALRGWI